MIGQSKTKRRVNPREHLAMAIMKVAVDTPSSNDAIDAKLPVFNPAIIVRTDRVRSFSETSRMRRTKSEQVRKNKTAIPPALGEADAPADCWIISELIGGRRV